MYDQEYPAFVRPTGQAHTRNVAALALKLVADRLTKTTEMASDYMLEGGDLLSIYVREAINAPRHAYLQQGFSDYAHALVSEAEKFVYTAIIHERDREDL